MTLRFEPATRQQLKVKVGLMGTAGTGKTWNALALATNLGSSVGVIDSERGRARAYAGDFRFEHLVLPDTKPETYIDALAAGVSEGYDVIVVDSGSHEWAGSEGILSSVDRFGGWKEQTPRHDKFIDALFSCPRHVIVTLRAKTQYAAEMVPRADGRGERQEITKLGIGPIQRDNVEYEFDVLGMVNMDHSIRLHKSIISGLESGSILEAGDDPRDLGRSLAERIKSWVNEGEPIPEPEEAPDEQIAYLISLLRAEGFEPEKISSVFAKRRLEFGALTEQYVQEAIAKSEARLREEGRDPATATVARESLEGSADSVPPREEAATV